MTEPECPLCRAIQEYCLREAKRLAEQAADLIRAGYEPEELIVLHVAGEQASVMPRTVLPKPNLPTSRG